MRVEFKGKLSEVRRQAAEWKGANPKAQILDESAPFGAGYALPGRDLLDEPNWTIKIDYEYPA